MQRSMELQPCCPHCAAKMEEVYEKLRAQLAEAQADLRAVLKVLTAIPAHRDYDSHYGDALARPGVRRLLAAREKEAT